MLKSIKQKLPYIFQAKAIIAIVVFLVASFSVLAAYQVRQSNQQAGSGSDIANQIDSDFSDASFLNSANGSSGGRSGTTVLEGSDGDRESASGDQGSYSQEDGNDSNDSSSNTDNAGGSGDSGSGAPSDPGEPISTVPECNGVVVSLCIELASQGANGDGVTDNTAVLNSLFSAAKSGSYFVLESGATYAHNDIITISSSNITITGNGTFLATNESSSVISVEGSNVTIDGPAINMQSTTQRWSAFNTMKLALKNSSGAVIRNVSIDGSAAAGIFVDNSSNYLIEDVTVENTRADGIHNTNGSNNGTITRATARNNGDDGIAIVSYQSQSAITRDITINSPEVYNNVHGRGLTVVGGENITFNDVYVKSSNAAALYVASEFAYTTMTASNVTFNGGTLEDSNVNAGVDHGAILVYNSMAANILSDITFKDIDIVNTNSAVSRQVGLLSIYGGGTERVEFNNLDMTGGPANPFSINGTNLYNRIDWTQNGSMLGDVIQF